MADTDLAKKEFQNICNEGAAEAAKKSKNKKKKAAEKAAAAEAASGPALDKSLGQLHPAELVERLSINRPVADSIRNKDREHAFWDTQPVLPMNANLPTDCGPIDEVRTPADVQNDPYTLPGSFEWCEVSLEEEKEIQELYTLLFENYVEDDDGAFRYDYSLPFLRWAMTAPGWQKFWHLGVRVAANKKLVAFISAIPTVASVHGSTVKLVEINFLCVHKKLRSKRLAPVLIKEITRRTNKQDIWQAVYTAGVLLPRPVAECRFFHRPLNPKKLVDAGFHQLSARMTLSRTIKLYKVPDEPQVKGIRAMEPKDMGSVHELLTEHLKKYALHQSFTEVEFAHWILPREGVMYSFVRENDDGRITDMCSFYSLSTTVLGNEKVNSIKVDVARRPTTCTRPYSYYNVATSVPLQELLTDAMVFAKQADFDVFNMQNLMDNKCCVDELKFAEGSGINHYYLFNWKCPQVPPEGVGFIML